MHINDCSVRETMNTSKNLEAQQFIVLFNLLASLSLRDKEYLISAYSRSAQNFNQTFDFLKQIKVISEAQGKLIYSRKLLSSLKEYKKIADQQKIEWINEYLIDALISNRTEISIEFINYLHNFQFKEELFIFQPSGSDNIRYADIRNFLIDLGLVEYDTNRKLYIFLRPALLSESIDAEKFISLSAFEKIQASKKELGEKAELIALKHEQDRLVHLPKLATEIRHIAKEIVNAGFDIESFTEVETGQWVKRFIEVKAVLKNRPRFFLSRNELEKSKELGKSYWLYLVPYNSKQKFEPENIDKICDPYQTVFLDENTWERKIELYSFSK
jgi:hypothetical protein